MDFSVTQLQVVIAMITSLLIASVAIPTIVTVAGKKGLVAAQNGRTSHKGEVPVLGGLALFLGVGISTAMWTVSTDFPELNGILGASLILTAIGLKDDILIIDPYKKMVGEVMAATMLVLFAGIRFTSFQGTLGTLQLGYALSILFSVLVITIVINAFNLIDGIDGLASGIGILASMVYAYWFYRVGEIAFAVFASATMGALAGFFYFNVLGNRNKIFMGDTGALLLGMIFAVLSIKFCETNLRVVSSYRMSSAPAIAIALLSIPLFDIFRVFMIRIFRKKSPFRADKNHVHHILISLNFTHIEASMILLILNVILVTLAIMLRGMNNMLLILLQFSIFMAFVSVLRILSRYRIRVRTKPVDLNDTRFGRMVAHLKNGAPEVAVDGSISNSQGGKKGERAA